LRPQARSVQHFEKKRGRLFNLADRSGALDLVRKPGVYRKENGGEELFKIGLIIDWGKTIVGSNRKKTEGGGK